MSLEIKLYAAIGLLIAILGFGTYLHFHLINEGKAEQRAQDAADAAKALKKLQAVADQAARDRDAKDKELSDYRAAHPTGSVLVCDAPSAVPARPAGGARPASSAARPAPVPEVLDGSKGESVEVGPSLDVILSSAARLAELDQERAQIDSKR